MKPPGSTLTDSRWANTFGKCYLVCWSGVGIEAGVSKGRALHLAPQQRNEYMFHECPDVFNRPRPRAALEFTAKDGVPREPTRRGVGGMMHVAHKVNRPVGARGHAIGGELDANTATYEPAVALDLRGRPQRARYDWDEVHIQEDRARSFSSAAEEIVEASHCLGSVSTPSHVRWTPPRTVEI